MPASSVSDSLAAATAGHGASVLELLPRALLHDLADTASVCTRAELGDLDELAASASPDANFLLSTGCRHRGGPRIQNRPLARPACSTAPLYTDKQALLKSLDRNPFALQFASEELRDDYDAVAHAVSVNGLALEYASPALQGERQIVLSALQSGGCGVLKFASPALCADRDLAMAVVAVGMNPLPHMSSELAGDYDIAFKLAVTMRNACDLKHVPQRLRDDRAFLLEVVAENGEILASLPEQWQADLEVAVTAVRRSPLALQHVSRELRNDKGLVRVAVEGDPCAFRFAGDMLKSDFELSLLALAGGWNGFQYVARSLRRSHEFASAVFALHPHVLDIKLHCPPGRTRLAKTKTAVFGLGQEELDARLDILRIKMQRQHIVVSRSSDHCNGHYWLVDHLYAANGKYVNEQGATMYFNDGHWRISAQAIGGSHGKCLYRGPPLQKVSRGLALHVAHDPPSGHWSPQGQHPPCFVQVLLYGPAADFDLLVRQRLAQLPAAPDRSLFL